MVIFGLFFVGLGGHGEPGESQRPNDNQQPGFRAIQIFVFDWQVSLNLEFGNIISQRQAAYLKGDSTIQQVLYIVHIIRTAWFKKTIIQEVVLDVSADFDKAWHSGIMAILEQIQMKDSALNLFKSYLSNKVQITVVDTKKRVLKSKFKLGCRKDPGLVLCCGLCSIIKVHSPCSSQWCYYPFIKTKTQREGDQLRTKYKDRLKGLSGLASSVSGLALLASGPGFICQRIGFICQHTVYMNRVLIMKKNMLATG